MRRIWQKIMVLCLCMVVLTVSLTGCEKIEPQRGTVLSYNYGAATAEKVRSINEGPLYEKLKGLSDENEWLLLEEHNYGNFRNLDFCLTLHEDEIDNLGEHYDNNEGPTIKNWKALGKFRNFVKAFYKEVLVDLDPKEYRQIFISFYSYKKDPMNPMKKIRKGHAFIWFMVTEDWKWTWQPIGVGKDLLGEHLDEKNTEWRKLLEEDRFFTVHYKYGEQLNHQWNPNKDK